MQTVRSIRLLVTLLSLALAGCSGSGSSGFDISSENAAIDRVLTNQQCIDFEGLIICPANPSPTGPHFPPSPTPTPTRTPSVASFPTSTPSAGHAPTPTQPTPTPIRSVASTATATIRAAPTPPMQVDTTVELDSPLACGSTGCAFTLAFSARGFEAGTAFFVAVRTTEPLGRWRIDPVPERSSGPFGGRFEVPIAIAATGASPTVQIAVLVFEVAPASLPADVVTLGETHADFAYVTNPIVLASQR